MDNKIIEKLFYIKIYLIYKQYYSFKNQQNSENF